MIASELRPVVPGALQGEIELPADVLAAARVLAAECFAQAEAEEFSGDAVVEVVMPLWLAGRRAWLPLDALARMGLAPACPERDALLCTPSVEPHTDDAGLALIVVLYNDGLVFRQGRQRHATRPGQWFVLDDRRLHAVDATDTTTSYLALSVPLAPAAQDLVT